MIQLGKVKGNQMVDMQLSNDKLIVRGTKMIQKELSISEQHALDLLTTYKSVRNAINNYKTNDNQAH
jgi:N-acetylmuramic acid 6-phosphate etherase